MRIKKSKLAIHFFLILNFFLFFSIDLFAQDTAYLGPINSKTFYSGLLLSYSGVEKDNTKSTFENVVNSNQKKASIRLGGGYLVTNRISIGIGLSLGNEILTKEILNLTGPNTKILNKSKSFGVSPMIRNYIPLDKLNHFYLYAQTGLIYSFSNGTQLSNTGNVNNLTQINSNNYGVSFTPGILAFVNNAFAMELNIGAGGVNYTKEIQRVAGQADAIVKETNLDLNLNILKLNLGFSYYFK